MLLLLVDVGARQLLKTELDTKGRRQVATRRFSCHNNVIDFKPQINDGIIPIHKSQIDVGNLFQGDGKGMFWKQCIFGTNHHGSRRRTPIQQIRQIGGNGMRKESTPCQVKDKITLSVATAGTGKTLFGILRRGGG
jgi:hypothetical protein